MQAINAKQLRLMPPLATTCGFSLVEVLLAVALASSTLLALTALMSNGLDVVIDAGRTTISSQITRTVATRLQQASWTINAAGAPVLPDAVAGGVFFFDAQGTETVSRTDAATVYEAVVAWAPSGQELPGGQVNPFTRPVTISVRPSNAVTAANSPMQSFTTLSVTSLLPES